MSKKYELNEQQRSNALAFLNRVSATGIEENQAYMELVHALHKPVKDEQDNIIPKPE